MRFIGIVLIMGHHLYLLGFKDDYLFRNCWVWVDFYFILTGAFTYKHFLNDERNVNYGDEALGYTFEKYKRFFWLTSISVLVMCFLTYGNLLTNSDWKAFLFSARYASFEMGYLSSSGIVRALNAPLGFLSAMFITLPVIAFLIQAHRELWKIISFVLPILYFGYYGVNTKRAWPNDMLRALVCMALGTMAYILSQKIRGYVRDSKKIRCFVLSLK